MVGFRKNDAKVLTHDWHAFRANARRTAFHEENFSDADRTEYDLDTAGITGQDNTRNYVWDTSVDLFGINGTDVRTLEDR